MRNPPEPVKGISWEGFPGPTCEDDMPTRTIPCATRAIMAALATTKGRRRERLLTEAEVEEAIRQHRRARRWARKYEITGIRTRVWGGTVPNNYAYRATCDYVELLDGRVVDVGPGHARTGPHGVADTISTDLRVPAGTEMDATVKAHLPRTARLHGGYLRWIR